MNIIRNSTLVVLTCLLCGLPLFAQEGEPFSPFQFSLVYPLGTHGLRAMEYTNGASLNLLVGVSKNERNFTLAGISNVVSGKAKGVQLAGLSNHIGDIGKGLALAGALNFTSNSYKGVQIAGLVNRSGAETNGLMLAGLGNIAKGRFEGLQFSLLFNVAQEVKGVQFATWLNIAEECDYPIGLINLIKKGEKGIALTYDGLGNTVLSFRSGGKYTYGIVGIGFNHRMESDDKMVTEAGYGIHIPVCRWMQINNEIKATTIGAISITPPLNLGYLLAPSFKIQRHFNLFGGVSINYFTSLFAYTDELLPNNSLWTQRKGGRVQQVYIGYQVGVQYLF